MHNPPTDRPCTQCRWASFPPAHELETGESSYAQAVCTRKPRKRDTLNITLSAISGENYGNRAQYPSLIEERAPATWLDAVMLRKCGRVGRFWEPIDPE